MFDQPIQVILFFIVVVGTIAAALEADRYNRNRSICFPITPNGDIKHKMILLKFLKSEDRHFNKRANGYSMKHQILLRNGSFHYFKVTDSTELKIVEKNFRENKLKSLLFQYFIKKIENGDYFTFQEASLINGYFLDNKDYEFYELLPEEMRFMEAPIILPDVRQIGLRTKQWSNHF